MYEKHFISLPTKKHKIQIKSISANIMFLMVITCFKHVTPPPHSNFKKDGEREREWERKREIKWLSVVCEQFDIALKVSRRDSGPDPLNFLDQIDF